MAALTREETQALHRLEIQRDRLLADDEALTKLLAEYPNADSQHLRTLIRAGRKEIQHNLRMAGAFSPIQSKCTLSVLHRSIASESEKKT